MTFKVNPTINNGILHPEWKLVLRPNDLVRHAPHPLLIRELAGADPHLKVNDFLKKQISRARRIIDPAFSRHLITVVFGPRRFDDFPLTDFLERGIVCGLDLDAAAMGEARSALDENLKPRLLTLKIDASLLANELLDSTQIVTKMHRQLNDSTLAELRSKYEQDKVVRQLPFNDHSLDMAVSTSVVLNFAANLYNRITEHLWGQYGVRQYRDFFNEKTDLEGARFKGGLLENSFNKAYHKIARAHLLEMGRVVKKGGVIFISDHLMKISGVNSTGSFSILQERLVPANILLTDVRVKTALGTLELEVSNEARDIQVYGKDSLESIIKESGKFKILNKFYFWNVNYWGDAQEGVPGDYFLDVALVLRPL